ncbi:MAG: hypothetical protein Q9163_005998 [Psora crenata]
MRFLFPALLLCAGLLALVTSFTPQDHEIFRLRDEIAATEGKDVTFYDFLGVESSASQDEISKAYRKKSRLLHPDKAKQSFIASRAKATTKPKLPGGKKPKVHVNKRPAESEIQKEVKLAGERYARLGVVAEILKGSGRERYDFFLAKGFPKWRGTGYYYARFRPGLGTVILGLFFFGGGLVHYAAMYISWKRQGEFMERYIRHARRTAWGDDSGIKGIPGLDGAMTGTAATPSSTFAQDNGAAVINRRQKRMQEKEAKKEKKSGRVSKGSGVSTPQESEPETSGPQGAKKRVQATNGKILIVDSIGNVYLEEENEDGVTAEYLLDPGEIPKPTYRQTLVFRLPAWAYRTAKTRLLGTRKSVEELGTNVNASNGNGDTGGAIGHNGSNTDNTRRRSKRIGKA